MKIFYFILFLSHYLVAQENLTPFDFIEASRKYNQLSALNGTTPQRCLPVVSSQGEQILSCAIKDTDYDAPVMKLDFPANEIPVALAGQLSDQFKEETKNK